MGKLGSVSIASLARSCEKTPRRLLKDDPDVVDGEEIIITIVCTECVS